MTQDELGRVVGANKNSISAYENGVNDTSPMLLASIAEVTGVTIDWLVTGREPVAPIVSDFGEEYLHDGKTEEEIMREHFDGLVEMMVKDGVERVIAEKMLEAVIREMRITGTGPDGYISLGDFLRDAKRRLDKEAAHQGQAAEGDTAE